MINIFHPKILMLLGTVLIIAITTIYLTSCKKKPAQNESNDRTTSHK